MRAITFKNIFLKKSGLEQNYYWILFCGVWFTSLILDNNYALKRQLAIIFSLRDNIQTRVYIYTSLFQEELTQGSFWVWARPMRGGEPIPIMVPGMGTDWAQATPADTQRKNNVTMTLRRRRFGVIMTLLLRRVPVGTTSNRSSIKPFWYVFRETYSLWQGLCVVFHLFNS